MVILHSSPIVAEALRHGVRALDPAVAIDTKYSWTDFARTWDFAASWVIVDAYLDDHVPLALKVRSLVRVRSGVIVLGTMYSPALRDRALAEGAVTWLEPAQPLPDIVTDICAVTAVRPHGRPVTPRPGTALTDRELQLAGLHASRRGLTPTAIGRSLGLAPSTVKAHIAATRRKYRENGIPVRSREELAAALIADGYLVADDDWRRQARW
ncbi:hypothetical protein AZH51_04235 [Branchiibius sp. NY16-3462-2]|nr:hypothetical protein AZH51_04235 [Branchiibius sp. NY16-3462-2]